MEGVWMGVVKRFAGSESEHPHHLRLCCTLGRLVHAEMLVYRVYGPGSYYTSRYSIFKVVR